MFQISYNTQKQHDCNSYSPYSGTTIGVYELSGE